MKQTLRTSVIRLSLVLLTISGFGCAPGQKGSSPADPGKGPVVQGTVSGGGGNGCEGKAFETYAKKISELQEYQLYLRPLLRRMAESSRDPFVTYLLWTAEEKAWYFVPCELEKLSTEQIGVAVHSDQLARHGENGIFIHSRELEKGVAEDPKRPNYATKKSKAKATLLLHEMVMGARLLMKKSPLEQCTALAKKDAKLCSDPDAMAIATATPYDRAQAKVMDAVDHDAVYAMTAFLMAKNVDLSTASLRTTRERLGFNFPWSRAVSDLDLRGLNKVFNRTAQLVDRFTMVSEDASKTYFKGLPMTCGLGVTVDPDHTSASLSVSFVSKLASDNPEDLATFYKYFGEGSSTTTRCRSHSDNVSFWVSSPDSWTAPPCDQTGALYASTKESFGAWLRDDWMRARGVLVDGVLYDQITIRSISPQVGGKYLDAGVVQILVTREPSPRVYSIRMMPKQVLAPPGSPRLYGRELMSNRVELLDIPGAPALECRNQSLAR